VKAGDQVLCGKYSGAEITVEGVKFCLLREDDLLAVIEAE